MAAPNWTPRDLPSVFGGTVPAAAADRRPGRVLPHHRAGFAHRDTIGTAISNLHQHCNDSTRDNPASGAAVQGVSRRHRAGPPAIRENDTLSEHLPRPGVRQPGSLGRTAICRADPRGFLARLQNGAIIDEVQRVPDLLSYIQVVVDEKGSNSLFVLTGSAQPKLTDKVQSLAGRTALLRLLPLSLTERRRTGASSAVDDILYSGFHPRIIAGKLNPTEALADYFDTYVERDVRQLAEFQDLPLFQNFVRLCAGRVGQLVNLSSLGRDAGVSNHTAGAWLALLERSFISFRLRPYFANIRKRLVKAPKLYFHDVGLAAYLIGIEHAGQIAPHPLRGHLFENAVVVEALKHRFNRGKRADTLSFFRDAKGLECDLLYPVGQGIAAFEVKSGATTGADAFRSLNRVAEVVPNVTSKFVVYGGTERQPRSAGTVIPLANLGGTLARLEVGREFDDFVDENQGPEPDESDIRDLDLSFRRFIRPVLDELETERRSVAGFFGTASSFSCVKMDNTTTQSGDDLLAARRWPRTKSQYIVVGGFQLSDTRPLELWRTYRFERYTGKGQGGFKVEFSIRWRLDRATLSRSATIDNQPIPELATSVDRQHWGHEIVDVDQTAAVFTGRITQRIGELSAGTGTPPPEPG